MCMCFSRRSCMCFKFFSHPFGRAAARVLLFFETLIPFVRGSNEGACFRCMINSNTFALILVRRVVDAALFYKYKRKRKNGHYSKFRCLQNEKKPPTAFPLFPREFSPNTTKHASTWDSICIMVCLVVINERQSAHLPARVADRTTSSGIVFMKF